MAVIGSQPRRHSVLCDYCFFMDAKKEKEDRFYLNVEENTYPRSGLDHPTIAIGDRLDLVAESLGIGMRLQDNTKVFIVTGIELERDLQGRWQWVVLFKLNTGEI